jgi:uncharacterized membrane protein YhaH (DUF805 family)
MGIDDARAHRLEYFLPCVISLFVVCAPFTFIGYTFDSGSSWGDSVGAGIGLLVGLALWIVLLVAFIANGGAQPLRDRRRERRRLAQIESRRERGRAQ